MGRGLFGRRRAAPSTEEVADWPRLPELPHTSDEQTLDAPAVAYLAASAPAAPPASATPEQDLLEGIAAFRGSVADALFEASRDYQVLCSLVHENLPACEEAVEELRRRLAGNLHYTVLAKLDEMHALVAARVAGTPDP